MSKENYIEEIRPHDSAYKHVSGYAEYTDCLLYTSDAADD